MSALPVLAGYIYPKRMPWAAIVADLNAAGCSTAGIARILGIDHSTVQGWVAGSEPRHSTGVSLLALHAHICPNLPEKRQGESVPRA